MIFWGAAFGNAASAGLHAFGMTTMHSNCANSRDNVVLLFVSAHTPRPRPVEAEEGSNAVSHPAGKKSTEMRAWNPPHAGRASQACRASSALCAAFLRTLNNVQARDSMKNSTGSLRCLSPESKGQTDCADVPGEDAVRRAAAGLLATPACRLPAPAFSGFSGCRLLP